MKFLIDGTSDLILTKLREESRAEDTVLEERKKFLEKAADDLNRDAKKSHKKFWKGAEARLRELKLIPEEIEDPSLQADDDGNFFLRDKKKNKHGGECGCIACALKTMFE